MSSLPRNVKKPHFAAHRAHVERQPGESWEELAKRAGWGPPPPHQGGKAKPARRLPTFEKMALKCEDVIAFNTTAEEFFIAWLTLAIEKAGDAGVSPAWVFQNAAFELNISTSTAKRYFIKHTAERAEFYSDGKRVWLRKEGSYE